MTKNAHKLGLNTLRTFWSVSTNFRSHLTYLYLQFEVDPAAPLLYVLRARWPAFIERHQKPNKPDINKTGRFVLRSLGKYFTSHRLFFIKTIICSTPGSAVRVSGTMWYLIHLFCENIAGIIFT